jgi:tRNA(adenine34) deaminase
MDENRREEIDRLYAALEAYVPQPDHEDDRYAWLAVAEAFKAAREGNAAVGALLVDENGHIVLSARNRMFYPYFRSDLHAEMELLTNYENILKGEKTLKGYTLYSSLEPCEMCTIRIINSGVSHVYYVAEDLGKGGITGPNKLAPHWARLAAYQEFGSARCAPELARISLALFELTIGDVVARMIERR